METSMKIENTIDFDKMKEKWADYAATEFAREKIKNIIPALSENELHKMIRETTESRSIIEKCGMPVPVSLDGIHEILSEAKAGGCLTPEQLEHFDRMLAAVSRMKGYLERGINYEIPLAYYAENLQTMDFIRETIAVQISNSAVHDRASGLLMSIRGEVARTESKMKEKAESCLRANKNFMSDNFCTLRNGRLCLPVKKEYRMKIPGKVLDKSSTGSTLFIEPDLVAKYQDELLQLHIEEENEVFRILYTISAMIAEQSDAAEENIRVIEQLDFIFSKGRLSLELKAVEPTINTKRRIMLKDARHPLLKKETCVPLQFSLGGNISGIVITGPNTGGKTVAIKTVLLICMMAQCGLHVPCTEADICMCTDYLWDIGDGQNLSENLSTFSAHITNVLKILSKAGSESLVIIDELGSGTDPAEGQGIAIAILEELQKTECLFLVTTHFAEVKTYAEDTPGICNARMTFNEETLQPLYQMVIGEAGESCALTIAHRLGMPERMILSAAKAAYGEEAAERYPFLKFLKTGAISAENGKKAETIKKMKKTSKTVQAGTLPDKYNIGDSVMIYPDKRIVIICHKINDKGYLQVQMPGEKTWVSHKRVKLHVAASQLYPDDYDFSIVFDSVRNRKLRHDMERKYTEGAIVYPNE